MDTAKPRTLPFSKRGFNFETTMWIFTRVTVLIMYALMLGWRGSSADSSSARRQAQTSAMCCTGHSFRTWRRIRLGRYG
jgi:hypothetical protein